MKLKLIFCLCMLPLLCLAQESQPQQFSNRYGMKMTRNDDGSYALLYAKKYAKFIDVNTIPDVMVPYTYQADRLKSKDYVEKHVEVDKDEYSMSNDGTVGNNLGESNLYVLAQVGCIDEIFQ